MTLQAVSNIITAFQQQQQHNLQKQRLATQENVRYTATTARILMNRQQPQQVNTRVTPTGSTAQAWNGVSYVSSTTSGSAPFIFSTPLVQNPTISRTQQQQVLLQQQIRSPFPGINNNANISNKLTEPYLTWSRQYSSSNGKDLFPSIIAI